MNYADYLTGRPFSAPQTNMYEQMLRQYFGAVQQFKAQLPDIEARATQARARKTGPTYNYGAAAQDEHQRPAQPKATLFGGI